MALSRQELADWHDDRDVHRIMSRWGKDDIVRTEKDGFVLVDRASLDTLAAS